MSEPRLRSVNYNPVIGGLTALSVAAIVGAVSYGLGHDERTVALHAGVSGLICFLAPIAVGIVAVVLFAGVALFGGGGPRRR
jgi:hypothetical protein